MSSNCLRILFLAVVSIGTVAPANAAEIAGVKIGQDGEPVAGIAITYGGESNYELWLLMKTKSLTFERDFNIPVDKGNDNRATLAGNIEVRIHRRNKPIATAKVKTLLLVRKPDKRWYVVGSEVWRTAKLAGVED